MFVDLPRRRKSHLRWATPLLATLMVASLIWIALLPDDAAWRATAYQLSNTEPGAEDSPTRNAPIRSLDAGLVFERESGERRQFLHTLEPRLRYTWIPFRDQDDLPVFDTALPDLNLVQLFRANRYVGADRLGDANELAAGLTTRLVRAESGQQYLSATIGQRFYFESPRVVLPGEVAETRSASNLVGEVELTAWRSWSAWALIIVTPSSRQRVLASSFDITEDCGQIDDDPQDLGLPIAKDASPGLYVWEGSGHFNGLDDVSYTGAAREIAWSDGLHWLAKHENEPPGEQPSDGSQSVLTITL